MRVLLFFSLTALFSILSVREHRVFWMSRPSTPLVSALVADAALGMLIGIRGLAELHPLPLPQSLLNAIFAGALVLGPNDLLKTFLAERALLRKQ